MLTRIALLGAVLAFAITLAPHEGHATERIAVCANLVLAIDSSGSTENDPLHFEVQIAGHATAFRDERVHAMIEGCAFGRIAVAAFTWSAPLYNDPGYRDCIPWRLLESAEDAKRFADDIERSCGIFGRILQGTDIGLAITVGQKLLGEASMLYESRRQIIDLSSNGEAGNGSGEYGLDRARWLAERGNVTVNSMVLDSEHKCGPIIGPDPTGLRRNLFEYFRDRVTTGPLSFTKCAESPDVYAEILIQKVRQEIAGEMWIEPSG